MIKNLFNRPMMALWPLLLQAFLARYEELAAYRLKFDVFLAGEFPKAHSPQAFSPDNSTNWLFQSVNHVILKMNYVSRNSFYRKTFAYNFYQQQLNLSA